MIRPSAIRHPLTTFLAVAAASATTAAAAPELPETQFQSDPPARCSSCEKWNRPQQPFKLFGNTYYVGTAELSVILIAGSEGLILIDGALPQSAPMIDRNIRALGFSTADIRLIVSSHAHYDHVGGISALQRASGATVAASASSARALQLGRPTPDDPQATSANNEFPAVRNVRVIQDGETLSAGNAKLTAHLTPGHTPGATSWSWQSCDGDRCLDFVYADSLTAVSADGFRFTGGPSAPSIVDSFRKSIHTVETLPCDVLISPHTALFRLQEKLKRREEGDAEAFVDRGACRAYAEAARARLDARIASEESRPEGSRQDP